MELGHTGIHLRSPPTFSLPSLNTRWPKRIHPQITKQLTMLPHVNVSLLDVHKWEWTEEQSDLGERWATLLRPEHYMTFSSNGVTIVVIIILLVLHATYIKKSSGGMAVLTKGEGRLPQDNWPVPAAPSARVMIQKLQLSTTPINRSPAPRDQIQDLTMGMMDAKLQQLCKEVTLQVN